VAARACQSRQHASEAWELAVTANGKWLARAARIRTVGFLFAMIPLIGLAFLLCLLSLILLSPLIAYAAIRGKHLKDPWKRPFLSAR
jgi:hypothetical protein